MSAQPTKLWPTEAFGEPRSLILASTSRYRAALMDELGVPYLSAAPEFDERALDHRFTEIEPAEFALELAEGKARSIASQHRDARIIAADQIAVLDVDGVATLLHQAGSEDRAIEQLMSMSGRAHDLINGVVVLDTSTGAIRRGVDSHRVTMRTFSRREAEAYAAQFAPLDCVGSYRIEDNSDLIDSVVGGDRSGVIGLPLPLLRELLDDS